jgi:phospholipase A1
MMSPIAGDPDCAQRQPNWPRSERQPMNCSIRLFRHAALVLIGALAIATEEAVAKAVDPGLARCAAVDDPGARLACYDALAGRPAEPMSVATTGQQPPAATAEQQSATAGKAGEKREEREALSVLLYRRNYLLPFTYNFNVNRNLPRQESIDIPFLAKGALDNAEVKFQISFEVPLWTRILNQPMDMYFGYTQLAFFQAYNREYSSPFRDTNYEPELGLNWAPQNASLRDWRISSTRLALDHQSNGRPDPLSRSWNRITGQVDAEHGNLDLSLRLWALLGANPSDNPDITDYLGYGELRAGYQLGKNHLGMMFRSVTHPTVQLDWSYPLGRRLRLYMQYFNGYGESLLDYNHSVNRIGIGFTLNDWP